MLGLSSPVFFKHLSTVSKYFVNEFGFILSTRYGSTIFSTIPSFIWFIAQSAKFASLKGSVLSSAGLAHRTSSKTTPKE
ncbi:hypothetical protein HanPI659440_Chr09g0342621 [Helianthus annuus]|nr:hypothetical protein HanPI659440_Chr09g0342621 [Helianthus annuus]